VSHLVCALCAVPTTQGEPCARVWLVGGRCLWDSVEERWLLSNSLDLCLVGLEIPNQRQADDCNRRAMAGTTLTTSLHNSSLCTTHTALHPSALHLLCTAAPLFLAPSFCTLCMHDTARSMSLNGAGQIPFGPMAPGPITGVSCWPCRTQHAAH